MPGRKFITFSVLIILIAGGIITIYFKNKLPKGFATIRNLQIEINNRPFRPIVINYIINLQSGNTALWPCSGFDYSRNNQHICSSKKQAISQLRNELQLIKDIGFNTVRIVGLGEPSLDNQSEGKITLYAKDNNGKDLSIPLSSEIEHNNYFNAIKDAIDVAAQCGLRTIFLVKMRPEHPSTSVLLKKFCSYFKNDTNLLAIDLFNEPLYFDNPEKEKEEINRIVKDWRKIVRKYAPNTLTTIGLEGIREVFRWDPNILDVDFISYHPYEYEPEQVLNEIFWYGKYTRLPWIIGETSIPSDNDSVPYLKQLHFAKKTMEQAFNCGAIGYSWWQFKDVDWEKFHPSFMGILNRKDSTKNSKGNFVHGSLKPVSLIFRNPTTKKSGQCRCPTNYYNYSNSKAFRLKGRIVDVRKKPVEGAVVLAWNQYWTHSYHTVTKKDGSFELLGSYPFYHWMASATMFKTIRNELNPDTAMLDAGMPTINLNTLTIEELSLGLFF